MAFFKRSIAKRFDLLFRRKKKNKFVDCVHKVIEARRSGCIDEDGNILKPLTEMLAEHDKLKKQAGNSAKKNHQESASEEALKAEVQNPRSPVRVRHRASVRDSYPLPEEDDGSEGYASAGETDDSFNPTAFLERNRRTSRRFSSNSEEGGHSNRRVRFSDEVQQFGGPENEPIDEHVATDPDAEAKPAKTTDEPDISSMPLTTKIKYFEGVMFSDQNNTKLPINKPLDGVNDQPPRPCPGSPEIRHRVKLFEDISKGIPIEPPLPKPRRAVQSCQYTQTKSKINFFEQLSHEC